MEVRRSARTVIRLLEPTLTSSRQPRTTNKDVVRGKTTSPSLRKTVCIRTRSKLAKVKPATIPYAYAETLS